MAEKKKKKEDENLADHLMNIRNGIVGFGKVRDRINNPTPKAAPASRAPQPLPGLKGTALESYLSKPMNQRNPNNKVQTQQYRMKGSAIRQGKASPTKRAKNVPPTMLGPSGRRKGVS